MKFYHTQMEISDNAYDKIDTAVTNKLTTFNSYESIYKPQLAKSQLPQERLGPRPNVSSKHKATIYTKINPSVGNVNHIAMYPNLTQRASAIELNNIRDATRKRLLGDVKENARGAITRHYEYDDRFYTNPQSVERSYVDPDLKNQLIQVTLSDPSYKQKIIAESLMTGKTNISRPITDKSGLAIIQHPDVKIGNYSDQTKSTDFATTRSYPMSTYEISAMKNAEIEINEVDINNMKKERYGNIDARKFPSSATIDQLTANHFDHQLLKSLDVSSQQLATHPTREILQLLNRQLDQVVMMLNDDRNESYEKRQLLSTIMSFRSLPHDKQLEVLELHKEEVKRQMKVKEDNRRVNNKIISLLTSPQYEGEKIDRIIISDKLLNIMRKLPENRLSEVCSYMYDQMKRFIIANSLSSRPVLNEIQSIKELTIVENIQLKRYIKKFFANINELNTVAIEQINHYLFDQEIRVMVDRLAMWRKIDKKLNMGVDLPVIYSDERKLIKLIPINQHQGLAIIGNPASDIVDIAIIDNFDMVREKLKRLSHRSGGLVSQRELETINIDILPHYINDAEMTSLHQSTLNLVLKEMKDKSLPQTSNFIDILKICQYYEDSVLKKKQASPVTTYRLYGVDEIEDIRKKIRQIFNDDISLHSIQTPDLEFEDLRVRKSPAADKYL